MTKRRLANRSSKSTNAYRMGVTALAAVLAAVCIGLAVFYVRAAGVTGDLNHDGVVNVFDLSILLSGWGTNNATDDLNGNGTVDVFDLSVLLSHWGQTGSTPTPSPSPSPVAAGCSSGGVVAPCVGGPTTGASGWGTPKFDDEFNGTSLDTTKWTTGWFGTGVTQAVNSSEPACFDPSHAVEGNGELDLKATIQSSSCGGKIQPDTSGMVTSMNKYDFSYGYAESRIWVPGSGPIYEWPSWWTDGYGTWPADGEIDVLEGLGGDACAHYHVTAYPNGLGACASGTWTGGWHTYGVDWEAGSLKFYYDGNLIWSDTNSIQGAKQFLILDMALSSALSSPSTATQRIDYVRVWQK